MRALHDSVLFDLGKDFNPEKTTNMSRGRSTPTYYILTLLPYTHTHTAVGKDFNPESMNSTKVQNPRRYGGAHSA